MQIIFQDSSLGSSRCKKMKNFDSKHLRFRPEGVKRARLITRNSKKFSRWRMKEKGKNKSLSLARKNENKLSVI